MTIKLTNSLVFVITALLAAPLAQVMQASNRTTRPQPLDKRVQHELAMLPYLTVFDDLSFRADNGRVTLLGEVTEPILKVDAENVVKHIEGVTRVNNMIELLPWSQRDNQIRMKTYEAIFGFSPLERYRAGLVPTIHIIVDHGNLILAGVVASESDREAAYLRANRIPGVLSVTNDLRVGS
jgi:hypothetical protein